MPARVLSGDKYYALNAGDEAGLEELEGHHAEEKDSRKRAKYWSLVVGHQNIFSRHIPDLVKKELSTNRTMILYFYILF